MNAFDDRSRSARAGALLSLVGVVNLPIIKFSVDWWNTLHQPASVVRIGGPSIALYHVGNGVLIDAADSNLLKRAPFSEGGDGGSGQPAAFGGSGGPENDSGEAGTSGATGAAGPSGADGPRGQAFRLWDNGRVLS